MATAIEKSDTFDKLLEKQCWYTAKKRDSRQQKRPNFVYFICCFCKVSLVAIVRLQWKDILNFHVTF